eukprot:718129-Amphidinium_carterae.1
MLSAPIVATKLALLSNLSLTPPHLSLSLHIHMVPIAPGSINPSKLLACSMPSLLKCLVPTSGGC